MEPQEELEQLLEPTRGPEARKLKERKKQLLEAQRRSTKDNPAERQIQRAQSRISAAERKRRTRRLILIGSYMEHVTQTDPDRKARLRKGLDSFLEQERDRELFGLVPKEVSKNEAIED